MGTKGGLEAPTPPAPAILGGDQQHSAGASSPYIPDGRETQLAKLEFEDVAGGAHSEQQF